MRACILLVSAFCVSVVAAHAQNSAPTSAAAGGVAVKDVNITPDKINPGDTAVLSWTTEFAVSCSFDQPVGLDPLPTNGSVAIRPPQTTSYRLTCRGDGGPASGEHQIHVRPQAQVTRMEATPPTIAGGGSSTISWASDNADDCVFNPDGVPVNRNDSKTVTPQATSTYSVSCRGIGQAATRSAVVTVALVRIVKFTANPNTNIAPDTEVELSWGSEFTSGDCTINPGLGGVKPNDSRRVRVSRTTPFEISCPGAGGPAVAVAPVTVAPVAIDTFVAAPNPTPKPGAKLVLSWRTKDAESCAIDQGIGPVDRSGDRPVDPGPGNDITYRLECTGQDGPARLDRKLAVTDQVSISELFAPEKASADSKVNVRWTAHHAKGGTCLFDQNSQTPIKVDESSATTRTIVAGDNVFTLSCDGDPIGQAHAEVHSCGTGGKPIKPCLLP